MFSDPTIPRRVNQHEKRLRTQEAQSFGPTLGEFYGSYLGLPGLRGFWPLSTVLESGNAVDLSGQARTLTYNGNPTYSYHNGLVPYLKLDGTGDVLTRADEAGLDIIGTEAIYAAAVRGLTIGGWFWVDTLSVQQGLIGKSNGASFAGSAYHLFVLGTNKFYWEVINAAAGASFSVTADATVVVDTWNFIVGRYTPSTELALFVNGIKKINTASIPASLNNEATAFNIGGAASTQLFDGRASACFLSAMSLSDDLISMLYNRGLPLFGA